MKTERWTITSSHVMAALNVARSTAINLMIELGARKIGESVGSHWRLSEERWSAYLSDQSTNIDALRIRPKQVLTPEELAYFNGTSKVLPS